MDPTLQALGLQDPNTEMHSITISETERRLILEALYVYEHGRNNNSLQSIQNICCCPQDLADVQQLTRKLTL